MWVYSPFRKAVIPKVLIHADCFGLIEGTKTVIYITYIIHTYRHIHSTYKYCIHSLSPLASDLFLLIFTIFTHACLLFPLPKSPLALIFLGIVRINGTGSQVSAATEMLRTAYCYCCVCLNTTGSICSHCWKVKVFEY